MTFRPRPFLFAAALLAVGLTLATLRPVLSADAPAANPSPHARPATMADSLAGMLPRIPPTPADEAVRKFKVAKGFRVELVAAEPLVTDPCAIEFDEDGRLWVCELWNYPGEPKPGEPLGRVRVLEDTDGDGRYNKSTLFADNIKWPSGIMPWDGGVFVLSSPDLLYLKDTDGDGKADVRRRVYTGFAGKTYEVPNTLRWGPDNRIYGAGSYAGGAVVPAENADTEAVRFGRGKDYRFDPRRKPTDAGAFEAVSGSGEWGNSFDDWGNRFVCHATNLVIHPVLPLEYADRNPYLAVPQLSESPMGEWSRVFPVSEPEPWKVVRQRFWAKWKDTSPDMRAGRFPASELAPHGYATAACGITVYRGETFGRDFRDNAFVAEPANNAVVRIALKPAGKGVGLDAARPPGTEKEEFLASTDTWFRPVNFANGPDGCLYVVDLYREVVEDESAIPDDILKHLDLYSGRDRGRIYRVMPESFRGRKPPRLSKAATTELVAMLRRPNGWGRDTAQRLLYQRQDKSAVEPLKSLVRAAELPESRIAALWALRGLGEADEGVVKAALADRDGRVRAVAVRLAEPFLGTSAAVADAVLELATDASPGVRFQAALSLQLLKDDRAVAALAKVARRDVDDPWARTAVLLAVPDRSTALFTVLAADDSFRKSPGGSQMLGQLAEMAGARGDKAEVAALLEAAVGTGGGANVGFQRAVLRRLSEGLAKSGSSLAAALAKEGAGGEDMKAAVDAFFADALNTAAGAGNEERDRLEAIGLLGFAPYSSVADPLSQLLDPAQPQTIQAAAVRALAAHADPAVGKLLVGRLRSFGPTARAEATDALFRRPDRLAVLLDAIEAGKVQVNEFDANRRQALAKHPDPAIRSRAKNLLGGPPAADRQAIIDRYRASLAKVAGDPARGAEVFGKNCAACHSQDAQKKNVAPNLATLDDRSPDKLLISILDPNRDVRPNFIGYTIVTKDGQDLTGVVANETTAGVTLRRAAGLEDTVLRSNIATMTSTGQSLMPDGLEGAIDEQQMGDLLRYLQELR